MSLTRKITANPIGWYRLYDQGEYGIQIMAYALDGRPGQCCTVDHDRLDANLAAMHRDDGYGCRLPHAGPFSWESGRGSAWNSPALCLRLAAEARQNARAFSAYPHGGPVVDDWKGVARGWLQRAKDIRGAVQ